MSTSCAGCYSLSFEDKNILWTDYETSGACPGDDSFHFFIWSKIAIKLMSWTWCWRPEMLGLFSCQACVKNETGKKAVGFIVWFRYYRAYPAQNVHISNLSSFRPTGLLFVRRSLQQSVPQDATTAAGVDTGYWGRCRRFHVRDPQACAQLNEV